MGSKSQTSAYSTAGMTERMSEGQLQQAIIELAERLHFLAYHTHDSRRSQAGFPDLVLVRRAELLTPGRVIFAELKREDGRVRPEQAVWLSALLSTNKVEVFLWRASDWRSGEVERVLLGAEES